MNEFEDQFMGDCGVEGRAEVHKEHPYICVGVLQGGQGCVECDGDSVLWGSVCLIGKLLAGGWEVMADSLGIGTMVVDLRGTALNHQYHQ